MRTFGVILLLLIAGLARGQGTLLYDQRSASETQGGGLYGYVIQSNRLVQAFTPSLDAVGFFRLKLYDKLPANGLGATVAVRLRSEAADGPILGTTDSLTLPNGFGGAMNLFFPTPVPVTAGTTYYFEPVVLAGDRCHIAAYHYFYRGGALFVDGAAASFSLWFAEGIIIPEPSAAALLLLGCGMLAWRRHSWHHVA